MSNFALMDTNAGSYIHIFARNCTVARITRPEAKSFLDKYHKMGFSSCRYCYGVFISREGRSGLAPGTLVAVATFSGARNWVKDGEKVRSCEWIRFAGIDGARIAGGMGKVMKAFVEEVHPDDIMTYVDPTWSDGDSYRKLGFVEEGVKVFPDGKTSLKLRLKLTSASQSREYLK